MKPVLPAVVSTLRKPRLALRARAKLRLVPPAARPLAKLSMAEKLAQAKAYVQGRGIYILDSGTPAPKWGVPSAGAKGKA